MFGGYLINQENTVELSRKEIFELQASIEFRQKEVKIIHEAESEKKKESCECEEILRTLASALNRLADERDKLIDYSNYHVLLVDDNSMVREVMSHMLMDNGFFHVDEAYDGHNAIVKMKEKEIPDGKQIPYDLVLCDLNMPMISGLDLLSLTRENSKFSTIPFIMVTGIMDKKNLLEAIKLGVSGYLTKPFKEEDLLAKIDNVLR
jgi:two-component system, chemotaxis family, chemotaxis protein CheY